MKKLAFPVIALLMATGSLFAKGGDDTTTLMLKQLEAFIKLKDSVK